MDFERFASPNWLSTTLSASSRSRKPPTNFIDEAKNSPITSGNGIVRVQQAVPPQYESTRPWIVVRRATFVHKDVGCVGRRPVFLRNHMLPPHRATDVR